MTVPIHQLKVKVLGGGGLVNNFSYLIAEQLWNWMWHIIINMYATHALHTRTPIKRHLPQLGLVQVEKKDKRLIAVCTKVHWKMSDNSEK